jgi:hypothetical protein
VRAANYAFINGEVITVNPEDGSSMRLLSGTAGPALWELRRGSCGCKAPRSAPAMTLIDGEVAFGGDGWSRETKPSRSCGKYCKLIR